jgi:hypothetical protein
MTTFHPYQMMLFICTVSLLSCNKKETQHIHYYEEKIERAIVEEKKEVQQEVAKKDEPVAIEPEKTEAYYDLGSVFAYFPRDTIATPTEADLKLLEGTWHYQDQILDNILEEKEVEEFKSSILLKNVGSVDKENFGNKFLKINFQRDMLYRVSYFENYKFRGNDYFYVSKNLSLYYRNRGKEYRLLSVSFSSDQTEATLLLYKRDKEAEHISRLKLTKKDKVDPLKVNFPEIKREESDPLYFSQKISRIAKNSKVHPCRNEDMLHEKIFLKALSLFNTELPAQYQLEYDPQVENSFLTGQDFCFMGVRGLKATTLVRDYAAKMIAPIYSLSNFDLVSAVFTVDLDQIDERMFYEENNNSKDKKYETFSLFKEDSIFSDKEKLQTLYFLKSLKMALGIINQEVNYYDYRFWEDNEISAIRKIYKEEN